MNTLIYINSIVRHAERGGNDLTLHAIGSEILCIKI